MMPGEQDLHREPVSARNSANQQFVCRCLHRPKNRLIDWSPVNVAGFKCP
jgi:hypothetical protein